VIRAMGSRCEAFCFVVVFVSVMNAGLISGLLYFFNADAHRVQRHVVELGGGSKKFPFGALGQVDDGDKEDIGGYAGGDEDLSKILIMSICSESKEDDTGSNMSDNSEFLIYDETPTKGSWMLGYGE